MKTKPVPYSGMFYYPDGSRRYRFAQYPTKLQGIFKRCAAVSLEVFKHDQIIFKSMKFEGGEIVSSYPNQLQLF